MSNVFVDISSVYAQAREAARAAVAGSPATTYGLEDVMPSDSWMSVTASGFMSLIPLHATLHGCVEALRARNTTAAHVEAVAGEPPHGTAVTSDDVRVARSWLADSLAGDVDDDGQEQIIDREAQDRGWSGDATRVTSLVLALVMVAGAAADR